MTQLPENLKLIISTSSSRKMKFFSYQTLTSYKENNLTDISNLSKIEQLPVNSILFTSISEQKLE